MKLKKERQQIKDLNEAHKDPGLEEDEKEKKD